MKAPEILEKAVQHMLDRAATYDKPEGERSMAQTIAVFNLFHGTSLTEAQGWHMMQILKDVRLFARGSYHADSAEDCVAYSALKAEALAKEKDEPNGKNPTNHWIEWEGGSNPVPGRKVEYVIKSQRREASPVPRVIYSHSLTWRHCGKETDIIRYKVVD